ncbi:hypothetical protein ACE1CI_16610 [Aerosakkonemataceae cyanobacterium BLCC-F50]|uniref:DUF5678 domain-containing protein n=1 Tax=Floridaenema flaviceps BLCC-F50 TaxID=3153642 RepID=A0ABV4XS72_9CYAN
MKTEEITPWEKLKIELAAKGFPTTYNSPEDFIRAIKLDFDRGGLHIARQLAFRALELYPDREQIQNYAHILAPPKATVSPSSPERRQSILADQEWMDKNRFKYIGRWVALRNGQLLADAASLDELAAQVGDLKGIFFTVIY